jgi:hypothetical protein
MRLQNARNTATPGPSNTGPQPVSTTQVSEDGSSLAAQTQLCSSTVEGVPTFVAKPQPVKPRPKGKGKAKAAEIGTTASMSLPQSADSTSAAIDADDVIQDEHDPARTTKRTLRKRKTATSATTIEDAGRVRVKRIRGQTRK